MAGEGNGARNGFRIECALGADGVRRCTTVLRDLYVLRRKSLKKSKEVLKKGKTKKVGRDTDGGPLITAGQMVLQIFIVKGTWCDKRKR